MSTIEQIAAALQGYDPEALNAGHVNAFLAQLVQPVTGTERVGVFAALGRVLADDLVSPISVPPHDNAAMDGYAFNGAALQPGQPLTLQRAEGTAFAGSAWAGTAGPGQCVKIMTGAIMPTGLDSVVPLEIVQVQGEQVTIPPDALQRGAHRRLLGEDLMAGQPALRRGQTLGPAALGLIASLGMAQVTVFRRLKVACFSTGDEILSLGEAPREGAVYDSNRYTVFGLLTRLGVEVLDMGVVKDEPVALEAAFRQAAREADAIITSGGVSTGDADHTQALLQQLGDVAFWRIAMRPGRPMAVGRIARDPVGDARCAAGPHHGQSAPDRAWTGSLTVPGAAPHEAGSVGAILFGLPGNPVAVMVTFLAFVRPALLRMMGCTASEPMLLKARSAEALSKKTGRTEYQRGIVTRKADGSLSVRTTGNQGSGMLRSMVEANGLIVLHHSQGNVAMGDEVDVMMFEGVI